MEEAMKVCRFCEYVNGAHSTMTIICPLSLPKKDQEAAVSAWQSGYRDGFEGRDVSQKDNQFYYWGHFKGQNYADAAGSDEFNPLVDSNPGQSIVPLPSIEEDW